MEQRQKTPLLEVKDISVTFRMYSGALEQEDLKVISSLSLDVYPGEILAIAHTNMSDISDALEMLENAFVINDEPVPYAPIIHKYIH